MLSDMAAATGHTWLVRTEMCITYKIYPDTRVLYGKKNLRYLINDFYSLHVGIITFWIYYVKQNTLKLISQLLFFF